MALSRARLLRLFTSLVKWAFGLAFLGAVALGATAWYFSRDLPSVAELKTYRPPQVTKVFCRGGSLCGEFYVERRTWVDVKALPRHVGEMFLAAEDADFYSHEGLDYLGILRSAVRNLRPGSRKSGASTISQQACRLLLLSQERTFSRKVREWLLTPRMEKALTKDEILNLYVNSIYYGHNRHGIEEAALFYFGKHAAELSLGEAAVLAGTVQLPHRINPLTSIVKAKRRQRYVLGQAAKHGFVSQAEAEAEMERPIVLGPRPAPPLGGYYVAEVRRQLIARHGEQAVFAGGMRVDVAMDPKLQRAAERAVREGLEAVDHRAGYRGPVGSVDLSRFATLRAAIEQRLLEAGKRRPDEVLVADLAVLATSATSAEPRLAAEVEAELALAAPQTTPGLEASDASEADAELQRLADRVTPRPATAGTELVGLVVEVDDKAGAATVDLVGRRARIDFKELAWARRRTAAGVGPKPAQISDVLRAGELVSLRLGGAVPATELLEASLAQTPLVQGALVVLRPEDRSVAALVGGYDWEASAFNRATQARRQPGSAFKPFVYGAALASGRFTPISQVNDAPEVIRDPWTGKTWKPQNFERNVFEGPITLRQALTKSKNTVSVRLVEALRVEPVMDFARKAGIRSKLPENSTLALGTGEVTLLELANAYATLQASGTLAEPLIVERVRDAVGTVLEERRTAFEETLPKAAAFLTTSLMQSVVEEGTAVAVLELGRPAAGKTGTAQEYRDAWFAGYTQDYVAAAWVGHDDHSPIGPLETGGRAALPLWLDLMKVAHEGLPARPFVPPEGVVEVRVDPATGLLAGSAVPGRLEYFLAGTEPRETTRTPGTVDPGEFLLHDGAKPGQR